MPAYIKGTFNLHRASTTDTTEIEEFTETESGGTNFYARQTANTKFACRISRPGCSTTAGNGDYWRPATIIADAMTLLSNGFVDGVRSDGDYDLNNNTGIQVETNFNPSNLSDTLHNPLPTPFDNSRQKRLQNGFWENNFVTSANWWQSTSGTIFPSTTVGSSYVLNGITPIQRRVNSYPMYVMEICRQDLVSQCLPGDWKVGFDVNGNSNLDDTVSFDVNGDGIVDNNDKEKDIKTYQLGKAIASASGYTASVLSNWDTQFGTTPNNKSIRQRLGAGDTGDKQALVTADQHYPRRVAFARGNSNQLVK